MSDSVESLRRQLIPVRLDGHSSITNYIRVINTQLCLFINHRQPASSCVNWWASRFYRGWRANITKKSEIVRVIWRAQISWCLFYWSGVPGFDLLIVRVIWRAWIWSLDRSRYWACLDSISWWLYAALKMSSRLLTPTAYHVHCDRDVLKSRDLSRSDAVNR